MSYRASSSEQLHRRLAGLHGHGRVGVHEVVVDGAHHLVEDHDWRLGYDYLPQPEVDPLPLHRVGNIFLLCYRVIGNWRKQYEGQAKIEQGKSGVTPTSPGVSCNYHLPEAYKFKSILGKVLHP